MQADPLPSEPPGKPKSNIKTKDIKLPEPQPPLEGINGRLNDIEEWIRELKDRIMEITAPEQKKKRMKRNEDSSRDLWDNIKHSNVHLIEVPEGEEKPTERA